MLTSGFPKDGEYINLPTILPSVFSVVKPRHGHDYIVFFPSELGELGEPGVVGTRYGGPAGGPWWRGVWAARSAVGIRW